MFVMILIIDDHADTCRMVARFIKTMDCEAVALNDPRRGLAEIEARRPGLVILDENMPWVSGLELLERIRGHEDAAIAQLHVVMYSASADAQVRGRAMELGVDGFVTKSNGVLGLMPFVRQCQAEVS